MSGFTYQTPDLASVLRTLASLAPPQPPQAAQPQPPPLVAPGDPPTSQQKDYELEEGEYEPPDSLYEVKTSLASSPASASERNLATREQQSRDPRLHLADTKPRPAPTEAINRPPPIDATSITDWSAGLKCVMKTVSQSDAIMARIKKVRRLKTGSRECNMKTRKHGMCPVVEISRLLLATWQLTGLHRWEGRQALLKKQEARVEGKKMLDEVLRSVGGIVPAGNTVSLRENQTPEQDAQELRTYEKKVYKASVEMAKAMNSELKSLGIPFFGTRSTLVRGKGSGLTAGGSVGGGGVPGGDDGKISEQELVVLQKRILELLEDMCK